jgi:hypothetical protein
MMVIIVYLDSYNISFFSKRFYHFYFLYCFLHYFSLFLMHLSFQQTFSSLELLCFIYMVLFLEKITLIEGLKSKILVSFI